MRIQGKILASLAIGGALCLGMAGNASAATLSWEETAAGITGNGSGTAYTTLPVSDHYGNDFGPSQGTLAAAPGFSFYDDFIFTVASSTVDAITSTIDFSNLLQIDDLQVRLYTLAGNPALPVLSNSPAGLKSGWSTPVNFSQSGESGEISVLSRTMLSAGSYVLEVRGDVVGSSGGSYSGTLNLAPVTPVPLPAALPFMLSGLGALGGMFRKRRAS